MKKFIRTAVDLGKNYFQFHGLAGEDGTFVSRKLKRSSQRTCNRVFFWHQKPTVSSPRQGPCGSQAEACRFGAVSGQLKRLGAEIQPSTVADAPCRGAWHKAAKVFASNIGATEGVADSRSIVGDSWRSAGHCGFKPAETVASVRVLVTRIRTGQWPDTSAQGMTAMGKASELARRDAASTCRRHIRSPSA